ncbi:MAG: HlyD family efflux transporter periplasmic adaptor subunit, partial [Chloroflexota bacterium]
KALDELLHPANTAVANAQKAVADAQDALDKARRDLRSVENPAGQSLYDTVDDTKLALDTATANRQLADNSADVQAYYTAAANTDAAFRRYQDAQAKYDESNNKTELLNRLEQARATYESALSQQQTLELRINTDKANKEDSVEDAQEKYDDAVANLNAALVGPDELKLATAQAKVAVAEANLADAQDKLNKLLNGADPDDIAAAEARVLAAQATANSLNLVAPFDGEVLAVNYQPGDSISQAQAAVMLANRSQLHVEVSVDETDVSQIAVGDPVTITLDPLPDLILNGEVSQISRYGVSVQGLVKYTVRVDLAGAGSQVLIGMTANANIVTDTVEGALAVPLDAV